jgi:hypothetical protein
VFIKYVQVDIKKCITWPKNMAKEGTLGDKTCIDFGFRSKNLKVLVNKICFLFFLKKIIEVA